jgi:DNA invertase Pin-like site-specific DNA recombinase
MLPQVEKKPSAYSYVRISKPEQLRGDGLRRQLQMSADYASEHELELVTDAPFLDLGVSAHKGKHVEFGALGRFLEAAEGGQILQGSYLLVESLDRLSRQTALEALMLLRRLLDTGILIVTLEDRRVLSRDLTDMDVMYSLVIMMRGHNESKEKSRRIAAAWSKKQAGASEKKVTKTCPSWLVLSDNRETFLVLEERAQIVERIFKQTVDGAGAYLICRRLIDDGIPPWGIAHLGRIPQWQESYIKKVLENRSVLGEASFYSGRGKQKSLTHTVQNYYPRIISDDVFDRARHARALRKGTGGARSKRVANLFSGVARCSFCHGPMRLRDRGAKQPRYLMCDNASRGIKGTSGILCTIRGVPYDLFETSFLRSSVEVGLQSMLLDTDHAKRVEVLQDRANSSAALEAKLRAKIVVLTDALEEGTSTPKAVISLIAKLEAEAEQAAAATVAIRHDIADTATDANAAIALDGEFREALSRMKNLSQEKRAVLRVALQQRIRQVIDWLWVFPLGNAMLDKKDIPGYLDEMERIYTAQKLAPADIRRLLFEENEQITKQTEIDEWKYVASFKSGRKMVVVVDRKDPSRVKRYVESDPKSGGQTAG